MRPSPTTTMVQAAEAGTADIIPHVGAAHAQGSSLAPHLDWEVLALVPVQHARPEAVGGEAARHVADGELVIG